MSGTKHTMSPQMAERVMARRRVKTLGYDGLTDQDIRRMPRQEAFDRSIEEVGYKETGKMQLRAILPQAVLLVLILVIWGLYELGCWVVSLF